MIKYNYIIFLTCPNKMIYFIIIIIFIFSSYLIRLYYINKSLYKQEQEITKYFNVRTNLIPAIFEVTENTFSKHDEIFKNILEYRKKELYKYYLQEYTDNLENEFIKLIHIEELIHHELNFIFKVANKHPKLLKKGNFIYLRDLLIQKSYKIAKLLDDYKHKVKLYNKLVLIPLYKKTEI